MNMMVHSEPSNMRICLFSAENIEMRYEDEGEME